MQAESLVQEMMQVHVKLRFLEMQISETGRRCSCIVLHEDGHTSAASKRQVQRIHELWLEVYLMQGECPCKEHSIRMRCLKRAVARVTSL